MKSDPSVFFVYSDQGGCGYLRCWLPCEELHNRGWRAHYGPGLAYTEDLLDEYDVIVWQRQGAGAAPELMERMRARGKANVYEIDDYALVLPPRERLQRMNGLDVRIADRESVMRCLRLADLVTVSTEELKRVYSRFNRYIVVLPNCTHPLVNVRRKPALQQAQGSGSRGERVTVGYAGALAHQPDMALLRGVLPELLRRYPQLDFLFFGEAPQWAQGLERCYRHEFTPIEDYYRTLHAFDVGVAPLVNSAFTRCKTSLKLFDYLGAGVAPVVSDMPTYAIGRHGVNCYKAASDKDWLEYVGRLVEHPRERIRLVEAGQALVEEYRMARQVWRWEQAYREVWERVQRRGPERTAWTGWAEARLGDPRRALQG